MIATRRIWCNVCDTSHEVEADDRGHVLITHEVCASVPAGFHEILCLEDWARGKAPCGRELYRFDDP